MYDIKIQGNEIKDRTGRKIGMLSGNDIKDSSGKRLGFIQGKDIKDSSGRRIAFVAGNDLKSANGQLLDKLDKISVSIDGPYHGVTMAAIWLFFVK